MKNPSPSAESMKVTSKDEPKPSLTSSQMTSSEIGSTMSKRDRLKAQKLLRKFQGEEPDHSSPTESPEEPTTSSKKKASVFSFFRTKTSWGPQLRMLIAGEFLFQYVRESAIHILQTSYADMLGLHPLDSFFLIELQLYAGSLLGFLIGWISDALLGQYTILVISLLFYCLVPILCSIASIPTIGLQFQKIILLALRYTFAIFTLAGGTRLAFLFSQDVSFEKNVVSSGFIFWCIFMRFLAKLIFSTFSMIPYETIFLLFNGFLIAISSIIYVGAFFIMKSQMVRITPYYRLVNQTIHYAFFHRFWSLFEKVLPKRLERPTEKIGLQYARNSGKQLSTFTFVFLPYVGYGTVNFLLQKLYLQQFKLLYSGKYVSVTLFYLPLDNLLTTSFLLAARYLLQPLFWNTSKYFKLTKLRAILISYLMMGGSLLWAYGIQVKIESIHSTPTLKLAKVFFYNGMFDNLTLKSEYFSTVITPKDLYVADVETQETKNAQIEYYVKPNSTFKVEIEIIKAAGVSYAIGESGVRRIHGTVPIYSAPVGSNYNGHPVTYALPIEKGIDGDLLVYNTKSESVETFVSLEYTENRKFFKINGGYYTAQFASMNTSNDSELIKLCIGGVYSFAIYPLPELSVKIYHMTKPVSLSEFLILPGMIMRSLSIALGIIPLYEFTHSQSPPHTISILMSYVIILQYGGCGIALWTQGIDYYGSLLNTSEEILIHVYILFGSFVLFTGLLFVFYKSKI